MVFVGNASIEEKLTILSDAAKYDVACTSSGVSRPGSKGSIGNTMASGVCHSFSADGRCISLLKVLLSNECIYNCKYCINRASNDVPRATFTPEELCTLTIEFYRRNYIEGLFLSSGIITSPDYTMELMCQTLHDLRTIYKFQGYIHCKAIPGASMELIEMAGWYADRMSINMELPTAEGLRHLAPNKSRKSILTPMRQVQIGMEESRERLGMRGGNRSAYWYTAKRMGRPMSSVPDDTSAASDSLTSSAAPGSLLPDERKDRTDCEASDSVFTDGGEVKLPDAVHTSATELSDTVPATSPREVLTQWNSTDTSRGFVPAGQSTQMIIGASGESDYEIVSVAEALYRRFDLKRVFYSAFVNVNRDASLPAVDGKPPLLREHRLYQADFLLRYYGFEAAELLSENRPNFNMFLDPKCDWALGHMELFPIEIYKADYNTLLRVPGIGSKSAARIVRARKFGKIDFDDLKKMGVVLKRALYFITCGGKMLYDFLKVEEDFITRHLLSEEKTLAENFALQDVKYKQLSLFDAN